MQTLVTILELLVSLVLMESLRGCAAVQQRSIFISRSQPAFVDPRWRNRRSRQLDRDDLPLASRPTWPRLDDVP